MTMIKVAVVCSIAILASVLTAAAADTISEKVSTVASEASRKIEDTSQAAVDKAQELWSRVDERRLKNRTADEIIGWAIMGTLAGSFASLVLVPSASRAQRLTNVGFGLVGALMPSCTNCTG